ncbi:serine protease [Neorhizobium sp. BT27B]|uniref:trypsin-like peptidase domain-containing protein n=1 Tax=Neorhizobium sp. BT27B TaxID=3142625 RepID=UPI003D2D7F2F
MTRFRRIAFASFAVALSGVAYFAAPTVAAYTEKLTAAPVTAAATVKVVTKTGHGSGVHIGTGFVLTAAHVARDVKSVQLVTKDGQSRQADVLWINNEYDIALLRTSPAMLPAAHLDCGRMDVGAVIEAMGNPLVVDFVSAYGNIAGDPRTQGPWKLVYITDITTVKGMSGGPVFSSSGDVVGITVGLLSDATGLIPIGVRFGFVVPSSDVCALLGRVS